MAAPSANEIRDAVRSYREQHEPAIVGEFARLLAIPNLAADSVNIRKNAEHIAGLLRARQVETRLLEHEAPRRSSSARSTCRARGKRSLSTCTTMASRPSRAVGPWDRSSRRSVSRTGRPSTCGPCRSVSIPSPRLFARSASDDKAPVIGIITALDALRAAGWKPTINLRFFFEGEEEAGSPHLAALLKAYERDLKTDLWIVCDGPVHQDGKKLVDFGVRGTTSVELTVYGPESRLAQRALRQLGPESHRHAHASARQHARHASAHSDSGLL
jgi:hypothetical protein